MADGKVVIKTDLDSSGAIQSAKKLGGTLKSGLGMATGVAVAGIGAVSTAVGALGAVAVKTGMDFDKAMAQVAATMGKSVDEISDLRDFAQQMGSTTAFSATEAAQALNYMALAGYDAQTSMKMLPNVLNLAAAGSIDLAYASDMVTDSQSALGLSLDQTDVLVDQMAKTSSKANASVSQLGEAILTVGGTAKNLKGGTTELNQVLGILADNGIKGAEGGTALRNIILSLSGTTKNAKAAIKEMGLEVYDADGNMRSMSEIFSDMNEALSSMTQEEKTQVLNDIFNKVDLKSVNALLGTNIGRWKELEKAINDADGAAANMAETQLDNLAGDVTLLKSAFEGMMIAISDLLTPSLRDFIQFGSDSISTLTTAIKEDGLTGAIKALPPIIGEAVTDIGEAVTKIAGVALDIIIALGDALIENAPELFTYVSDVFDSVLDWATTELPIYIDDFLDDFEEEAPKFIDMGATIIDNVITGLTDNAPLILTKLSDIITSLLLVGIESLPRWIEIGMQSAENLVQGWVESTPHLLENVRLVIDQMLDTLLSSGPDLVSTGIEMLSSLVEDYTTISDNITGIIPDIITDLTTKLDDNMPKIVDAGVDYFSAMIKNAPKILVNISTLIPRIGVAVVTGILDNLPKIASAGYKLFMGLWDKKEEILVDLVSFLPNVITSLAQEIEKMVYKFADAGKHLIEGLWDGISGAGDWLLDKMGGFCDDVVDGVCDFFGIASPSKVMRDQVGRYLAEGIYVGFDMYNPMDKIKKDLEFGMGKIENSMTLSGGYYEGTNYQKLGEAVTDAFVQAGITVSVDGRDYGRLVKEYV